MLPDTADGMNNFAKCRCRRCYLKQLLGDVGFGIGNFSRCSTCPNTGVLGCWVGMGGEWFMTIENNKNTIIEIIHYKLEL